MHGSRYWIAAFFFAKALACAAADETAFDYPVAPAASFGGIGAGHGCPEVGAFLLPAPFGSSGMQAYVLTDTVSTACAFDTPKADAGAAPEQAQQPEPAQQKTEADSTAPATFADPGLAARRDDAGARQAPDPTDAATRDAGAEAREDTRFSTSMPNWSAQGFREASAPHGAARRPAREDASGADWLAWISAALDRWIAVIFFVAAGLAGMVLIGVLGLLAYLRWFNERGVLARAIERGLKRKEFYLEYQPVFHSKTRKCIGLEVVLRWKNLAHGVRGDLWYMRLADHHTAMKLLAFVLATADSELNLLDGSRRLYAMVNLWAACFASEDHIARIAAIARSYRSNRLVLQVRAEDVRQSIGRIEHLHRNSVTVALAGVRDAEIVTSSAGSVGFEFVKVDRGVLWLDEDERRSTLQAIVAACSQLDLSVIADGVEGPGQYHAIGRAKIDLAQGFFLGKAIGARQLPALFGRLQWWQ